MEQIKAMIDAGHYYPTAPDAPEIDIDEAFWSKAKRVNPRPGKKTLVHLELRSDIVDRFKQAGPDYLRQMAEVLEDYAAKKAS